MNGILNKFIRTFSNENILCIKYFNRHCNLRYTIHSIRFAVEAIHLCVVWFSIERICNALYMCIGFRFNVHQELMQLACWAYSFLFLFGCIKNQLSGRYISSLVCSIESFIFDRNFCYFFSLAAAVAFLYFSFDNMVDIVRAKKKSIRKSNQHDAIGIPVHPCWIVKALSLEWSIQATKLSNVHPHFLISSVTYTIFLPNN